MNRPTPPADKGVGTDSKQYPGNSGTKLKLHSQLHIRVSVTPIIVIKNRNSFRLRHDVEILQNFFLSYVYLYVKRRFLIATVCCQ